MIDACPRLDTADNFRDLAGPGPGYAAPGGRVRRGVLYRSNRLELSEEDIASLVPLRIAAVHDLREVYEIDRHPNVELAGARALSHVVPGIEPDDLRRLDSVEATERAMTEHYRGFAAEPRKCAGFASALGAIVGGLRASGGPQVFHCSAGKDRTGWLGAMIHTAIGVSWDDVQADFLLTDERTTRSRGVNLASIEAVLGPQMALILEPAFHCSLDQLEVARAEAVRLYGGLDRYLSEGLGLSRDDLEVLRNRLVA